MVELKGCGLRENAQCGAWAHNLSAVSAFVCFSQRNPVGGYKSTGGATMTVKLGKRENNGAGWCIEDGGELSMQHVFVVDVSSPDALPLRGNTSEGQSE